MLGTSLSAIEEAHQEEEREVYVGTPPVSM